MRVFISHTMRGLTDQEILETREAAIRYAKSSIDLEEGDKIEIIDSFFQYEPTDVNPLWFLGRSLELLSVADICVFVGDWENARGCQIEHECCVKYGIPIIYFKL